MKCVILAGGFAKRMWPTTLDFPKSLLPVAGKPVIEHIIGKLDRLDEIDEIYISTNKKFESVFGKWLKGFGPKKRTRKRLRLIVEPSLKEEEKFGSVRAIDYFVKKFGVDDDVLVIGGDNIFSFDLNDFLGFSRGKKASAVAFFDMGDIDRVRGKFGVCILDGDSRITEFQEKPQEPKMVSEYLDDKNNPDAPGHFILWLSQKTPVHGFVSREKWYDIGSQETYKEADRDLRSKRERK
jgi:glucose-1-phosphate thymidylyltransferase